MKRLGSADLPLHGGYVPKWLSERIAKLGLAITNLSYQIMEKLKYSGGLATHSGFRASALY